ncbi:15766_t:CDS:2, partial [Gigaspora margarita]
MFKGALNIDFNEYLYNYEYIKPNPTVGRELKDELELSNNKERELLVKIKSLRREANCSSEHSEAINFKFGDHDSNNIGQLLNKIKRLKDDLENFCALEKSQYHKASIKMLSEKYKCSEQDYSDINTKKMIVNTNKTGHVPVVEVQNALYYK